MDWLQVIILISAILGTMIAVNKVFADKISKSVDRLEQDLKTQGERTDKAMSRIDQLYSMFVQLIREKK